MSLVVSLLHPTAIPERLGLALAEALRNAAPEARAALGETVAAGDPDRGPMAERRLLERALAAAEAGKQADPQGTPAPPPEEHPFLRNTRTIDPGHVFTIEYVPDRL